jgi:hypothetical protein
VTDILHNNGEQNGDDASCKRCGALLVPGLGRCSTCQSFVAGNQEARVLGLQARQHPAELRLTAEELMAGVIADRGGDAELSTLERAYIRRLGDVEITHQILVQDIAQNGLHKPSGNVRDVYDKFLAGLDRFDRLAQRVGISRRAKRVDLARALSGLDRE